jgi:hypothetical protein
MGLKPSEQANRQLLRLTTISTTQPFEGPKDVTASVPTAVALTAGDSIHVVARLVTEQRRGR